MLFTKALEISSLCAQRTGNTVRLMAEVNSVPHRKKRQAQLMEEDREMIEWIIKEVDKSNKHGAPCGDTIREHYEASLKIWMPEDDVV